MAIANPQLFRDLSGRSLAIVPGLIDENARKLYTNGQCMAFAERLASRIGGRIALLMDVEGNVVHAYAAKSGKLYDIEGSRSARALKGGLRNLNGLAHRRSKPSMVRSFKGYSLRSFRAAIQKGRGAFTVGMEIGNIQEQDFDLAGSFVESYLRSAGMTSGGGESPKANSISEVHAYSCSEALSALGAGGGNRNLSAVARSALSAHF